MVLILQNKSQAKNTDTIHSSLFNLEMLYNIQLTPISRPVMVTWNLVHNKDSDVRAPLETLLLVILDKVVGNQVVWDVLEASMTSVVVVLATIVHMIADKTREQVQREEVHPLETSLLGNHFSQRGVAETMNVNQPRRSWPKQQNQQKRLNHWKSLQTDGFQNQELKRPRCVMLKMVVSY